MEPAKTFLLEAIAAGKHVVTANKALLAQTGSEIFRKAAEKGVAVGFEVSVGGGIPVIKALREGLVANRILAISGIMNGTAIFCMWTANAIITWTFPPMMETLGGGITYTIYGVLNLIVAVVLFKIMPETKDKSLEEIEVEMEKLYS